MKYELTLSITDPKVFDVIEPEITRFTKDRSTIKINKEESSTNILIKAKDAVALRATIDSICQLLKVYESIKNG